MDAAEYAQMDLAEQEMWWYRALHRRLLAALPVGARVLDAGCGTGGLLLRMAGVPEAFGIDFSPAAAARAVRKSGRPVACGSVGVLPFADAAFDAAVMADVLCHRAVDPVAALAELRRVLRPGGRLVVNMPAYAWLASAHDWRVHNARRVTAGQLRGWLVAAGFERITTQYWNGLLLPLMVLHRITRRADAASDVAPFPPWLDTILHRVTRLEQMLPFPLPAGGSVLAIAHTPHHR